MDLDKRLVVSECDDESIIEILLAFLDVFEFLTESLVLLSECNSNEVDRSIAGIFKVSIRDVYVTVEAREFTVCDHWIFPGVVWIFYGCEVLGADLFVEGFLRDAEEIGGLCDGEIDFVWHGFHGCQRSAFSGFLSGFDVDVRKFVNEQLPALSGTKDVW